MKYLGIKIIDAIPMSRIEAKKKMYRVGEFIGEKEGYEISYKNGYKSWSPKNIFDEVNKLFPINDKEDISINLNIETEKWNIQDKRFKVITLCGSSRFKEQFLSEQKRLTLEGNIVITVGLFGHSGDDEVWIGNTKEMLDDMHRQKIDLADEIFVIDPEGYLGHSTINEIAYANSKNKKVNFYSQAQIFTSPTTEDDLPF